MKDGISKSSGKYFVNGKKIFFIRHNSNDRSCIEKLREEERIGLIYNDLPINTFQKDSSGDYSNESIRKSIISISHENEAIEISKGYAPALNYFDYLSKNGGHVFVEYLSGEMKPKMNSEGVMHSPRGCYLCEIKPQEIRSSKALNITLKIEPNPIEIEYARYPVILAIRAQGTIFAPNTITFALLCNHLINKEEITYSSDYMLPKVVEQLCVEYMREEKVWGENTLDYCSLRPGKQIATIDIAGITQSKKQIYAQVKNSKISKNDISLFIDFCREIEAENAIVFSKMENIDNCDGVTFVQIQKIIDYYKSSERGQALLKNLIGFN